MVHARNSKEIDMYSFNSSQLYYLLESTRANLSPLRYAVLAAQEWYESEYNPLYKSNFAQTMRASLEIAERISRRYTKPEFHIHDAVVSDKIYPVEQDVVMKKPFCDLLHFDKKIYTCSYLTNPLNVYLLKLF